MPAWPDIALAHFELFVRDPARTERFYVEALGFEVTDRGAGAGGPVFLSRDAGCFALVGIWVALLSDDEGFSGGLFFLSRESNVALGRWMFGLGALISLAIFARAWYLYNRGDD